MPSWLPTALLSAPSVYGIHHLFVCSCPVRGSISSYISDIRHSLFFPYCKYHKFKCVLRFTVLWGKSHSASFAHLHHCLCFLQAVWLNTAEAAMIAMAVILTLKKDQQALLLGGQRNPCFPIPTFRGISRSSISGERLSCLRLLTLGPPASPRILCLSL